MEQFFWHEADRITSSFFCVIQHRSSAYFCTRVCYATKEEMPFNIFRRQVLIDLLKAKSSKNMKENLPRVSLILFFLKLAFGYENTNTEEVKKKFFAQKIRENGYFFSWAF